MKKTIVSISLAFLLFSCSKNEKVALILLSYPQRARLKLYANAKIVDLQENEALYELLKPADYKFRPERMLVFHIKAYDWNCPQHITPRYTEQELEPMLKEQNEYIKSLEAEIQVLKNKAITS